MAKRAVLLLPARWTYLTTNKARRHTNCTSAGFVQITQTTLLSPGVTSWPTGSKQFWGFDIVPAVASRDARPGWFWGKATSLWLRLVLFLESLPQQWLTHCIDLDHVHVHSLQRVHDVPGCHHQSQSVHSAVQPVTWTVHIGFWSIKHLGMSKHRPTDEKAVQFYHTGVQAWGGPSQFI